MKPTEKAWEVPQHIFKEPWFAPEIIVYANTRSEAKTKALNKLDGEYLDKWDEPIGFLNIKILRKKSADKLLIDGEVKLQYEIDRDKSYKDREEMLNKLLLDNPGSMAYIKKGYNYYMPNNCGYTERKDTAGIYTLEDAIDSVRRCSLMDGMQAIVINKEEHNNMIMDKIKDLSTRIIL